MRNIREKAPKRSKWMQLQRGKRSEKASSDGNQGSPRQKKRARYSKKK